MVAAIVTYLVILIQFMFTERNNIGKSLKKTTLAIDIGSTRAISATESIASLDLN